MAKTSAVSLRLEPELDDKLAAVAAVLDRPKSWVIEITRILRGRQRWPGAAVNADVTMFSNFRAAAAIPSR